MKTTDQENLRVIFIPPFPTQTLFLLQIVLLEVNALPGMTPVSLYPEGAAAIGYEFDALIEHLVLRAFRRGQIKR